jgi:hypothetical protein
LSPFAPEFAKPAGMGAAPVPVKIDDGHIAERQVLIDIRPLYHAK